MGTTPVASDNALSALYQRIVESTSEGVWVIDAASETVFVNQSMADMLGYDREELVGKSMFELMDDEGRRIATANVERRKKGISEPHEFVFRRKDQRALWARLTTDVLHDEAGEYAGALALVIDVTHERVKEQERESLWRILDESLNEIYLFRERDLGFEYLNRGALRNLGYSPLETRSMSPLDIKPEHTRESFLALIAPLVGGSDQKLVFRTVHRRKDGSTYPVEVHLQLVPRGSGRVFLAIINDITDRLSAERELEQSEQRFRALIERSLDVLLLADAEGRLTLVSPSVTGMLGYTPAELLGRSPLEIVHPDDRAAAAATLQESVGSDSLGSLEFRARHADGSWRTLLGSTRNLLDDPAVGAMVLNARDVTSERRLEEQLHQSQRLESIGRLAGGVAHDFNNILTTILSCAAFLEEDAALGKLDLADVQEIRRAAERASDLTSQLLAFARKRLVRPQSLDLARIVVDHERFLRRVIGEDIELTTHIAEGVSPILADPSQVEQVILNLAVNARDSMKNEGRLTLEIQNVFLDESFAGTHGDVIPGPHVLLVVSDTGEGIPQDVLPHIFEPFFTTKPVGTGTGLGLATVYGIMRQLGGHIWVYSEPGVGTTFKLYFPCSTEGAVETTESSSPPTVRGTERVLVVEDDETVRRTIVRGLEGAGYDVHAEATPAAGLAWARAQSGRFELLVTDVVMPLMSGKQLATELLREHPNVRVLYVSGYTENTIVHRGVLEEGVELLAKPFSPTELRARVRALLDRE